MDDEKSIKITIIGDGGIGKTAMLVSFIENRFPQNCLPTVLEVRTVTKEYDEKFYKLNLFDTAGQEDWDSIRILAYPGSHVILVCFSVKSFESLDNIKKKWLPELKEHIPRAAIILVGTQCDLRDEDMNVSNKKDAKKNKVPKDSNKRQKAFITTVEGEEFKRLIGAYKYVECSALTHHNIDEVFQACVDAFNGKPTDNPSCFASLFSCFG